MKTIDLQSRKVDNMHMFKNRFTKAITSAAVTFLIAAIWIVIPLVLSIVITGILGIFWLFFSSIGWITTAIMVAGYLSVILLCLPFVFALAAGIIGFIYAKN